MKTLTLRFSVCLLAAGMMASCSTVIAEPVWKKAVAGDGPGDPKRLNSAELVVENLPKSRSGNPREYSVFGQAYQVMDSAQGFTQRGIASWYGKKFHGRPTSSGELYDMHEMTAAHKSLPLPTFVKVTRVDNGQSLIVKVNDRGPFVNDRIIDLSYAAAVELGLLKQGKAEVFIEALSTHDSVVAAELPSAEPAQTDIASVPESPGKKFLQVGAYSEAANAEAMLDSLQEFLVDVPAEITRDAARTLYRVRIGPISDSQSMRQAQGSLAQAGIDSYRVTTVNP